jgi:hypothetical protein
MDYFCLIKECVGTNRLTFFSRSDCLGDLVLQAAERHLEAFSLSESNFAITMVSKTIKKSHCGTVGELVFFVVFFWRW